MTDLTLWDPVSIGLRGTLAGVVAWTAGAAASVGVGLLALSLIDSGLTTRFAQSSAPEVSTASPTHSAVPGGSAGLTKSSSSAGSVPSPTTHETDRVLASPGGTAVARCYAAGAYLVSWSPGLGYQVADVRRGPAPEAVVVFQSNPRVIDLRVTCVTGVPQAKDGRGWRGF
jgi:hypothetical protein